LAVTRPPSEQVIVALPWYKIRTAAHRTPTSRARTVNAAARSSVRVLHVPGRPRPVLVAAGSCVQWAEPGVVPMRPRPDVNLDKLLGGVVGDGGQPYRRYWCVVTTMTSAGSWESRAWR
jgi:hypothetical protein